MKTKNGTKTSNLDAAWARRAANTASRAFVFFGLVCVGVGLALAELGLAMEDT